MLNTYAEARTAYLTARALGDWPTTVSAVEAMIVLRPCDEALPVLESYLRESRQMAGRVAFAESKKGRFLAAFGIRFKGVAA